MKNTQPKSEDALINQLDSVSALVELEMCQGRKIRKRNWDGDGVSTFHCVSH